MTSFNPSFYSYMVECDKWQNNTLNIYKHTNNYFIILDSGW